MSEPFQRRSLPGAGAVGRLLGRPRKANAIQQIEDLLASASRVRDVSAENVEEVCTRCGVDLARRFRTVRRSLYRRYLEHCLDDQAVSPEETDELAHLKRILQLDDAVVADVHDEVARTIYGQAIEQVLEDHQLDPEEEQFLQGLQKELQLPEPVAQRLYSEGTQKARQRFLDKTIAYDHVLVAPRERILELNGASAASFEDAVRDALTEAARAVPDLHRFEVTQVQGEVENGQVSTWKVALKAEFKPGE